MKHSSRDESRLNGAGRRNDFSVPRRRDEDSAAVSTFTPGTDYSLL